MKESEARHAERDAREHIAAHGKSGTHHESALARYLSVVRYDEEQRSRDTGAVPPVEEGSAGPDGDDRPAGAR